ncbi:MAG: hypothetical protein MUF83_03245 [Acidimicrobiales bacterium]|jgi:hypothetical protein|nr:hypothetical protein [Acidimicrobiales bacterium]
MATETVTIIGEDGQASTVTATVAGDDVLVAADALSASTGWSLEPEGLCRGDVCIPASLAPGLVRDDGIDLASFAAATGRLAVVDAAEGLVALGVGGAERARAMAELELPDITLPDLDGTEVALASFRGRKKLLVAFASW